MVGLAPSGAKTNIGELISENFLIGAPCQYLLMLNVYDDSGAITSGATTVLIQAELAWRFQGFLHRVTGV